MSQGNDSRFFAPYLQAAWGLKNHWYPALFSSELADDDVKGVQICGWPIALRRSRGQVYALHDECVHRGVRLSTRPTCLTDTTITCWYHGFAYDLQDGKLVSIVGAPDDDLIGKVRIRTFPTQEFQGIIFVFVGDEDYAPLPPLFDDLPFVPPKDYQFRSAHLLDEDAVIYGQHRKIRCNWRLATENGFDPGHVLIHRTNSIILAMSRHRTQQLAYRPVSDKALILFEEDGPKGIMNNMGTDAYVPVTENKVLNIKSATGTEFKFGGGRTSMYLPGVLMVENWPERGVTQFEWYVPIDDIHHEYWQVIAGNCPTEQAQAEFKFRYENFYAPLGLNDFNEADVSASEETQRAYERNGWGKETLFSLDAVLVGWRKVVSRHNRGVQSPPQ